MRIAHSSWFVLLSTSALAACTDASGAMGEAGGGLPNSGGTVAAGGQAPSGGVTGSGGLQSPSSGGSASAGGALAVGGQSSVGGGSASGGSGADPGGSGGASGGTVATGGAGSEQGAGGAPCVVDHGSETPSLHEYYESHFAIGAAIDTQYSKYDATLKKHFSSVTAEDQMKFDALQPTEGNFSYGTADQMVNYAVTNGMAVRGHALVWHRQTPSWVFSGTRDQVLARMKNHITKVMQHFQGKVTTWDVVNEAIMDDGTLRAMDEGTDQNSQWFGTLGESYIKEAFLAARAADPSAKLFYNDYYNYHPVRRQAIYDLLKGLLDEGVPVDGVGLQGHLNLQPGTDPNEQSYHQTVENLEQAIEMYSSLGLKVEVTEMDISLYLRGITYTPDMFYTAATFTSALQDEQAERYRSFFDMFRKHSDVIDRVTFWGIADDNTWLSEFSSGRKDFPLLFDAQQSPKPAFWAIVDFCR